MSEEEKLQQELEKSGEQYGKVAQSATSFYNGISNAGTIFDNFNEAILVSSERQQELSTKMDAVQAEISEIASTATEERRALTESEIVRMDELFAKMGELAEEEIAIQATYQESVKAQAEILSATHTGSLEEYEAYSQTLLNSANKTKDEIIAKADEQYLEESALLIAKYGEQATTQNEAYMAEVEAAQNKKNEIIENAIAENAEIYGIISQGYQDQIGTTLEYFANQNELRAQEEGEIARYNSERERINKEYDEARKNGLRLSYEDSLAQASELEHAQEEHIAKMGELGKEKAKAMSDEQAEQAGVWLALVADAELYGGEITGETEEMIDSMLKSLDDMPEGTRETMKNAMEPMLAEMEKKEPALFSKASGIAGGVLSRLKKSFDIHSPSRKTRKIFKEVMEGAELGMEDETDTLLGQTGDIAKDILNRFSDFDASIMADKLKSAVAGLNARIMTESFGGAQIANTQNTSSARTTNNYNFYEPVETPDEIARAIKKVNTFGLAGA